MRRKLSSIKGQLILMLVTAVIVFLLASFGYFGVVLNLIHNKEEVYVRNSLMQIVNNIQTVSGDMSRFAKMAAANNSTQELLTTSAPLKRLEASQELSHSIFSITQDSPDTAIVVTNNSESMIIAQKPALMILEEIKKDNQIGTFSEKSSGFTGLLHNPYDRSDYFAYYQPIMNMQQNILPQKKIGNCIVLTSVANLQSCINRVEATPNSLFFILDKNSETIVSNQSKFNPAVYTLLEAIRENRFKNATIQKINGNNHMIFLQEVPYTGWQVVGAVPLNEINSDLFSLLIFGVVLLVLLILSFIFWGFHITHSIAIPVIEISDFVQGDAYSKMSSRLHLKNKNEIGILADGINQMLDKISDMTHVLLQNQSDMYELDLAKKRAELSALQSQINPHFLYNTLDCIKGYGYLLQSNEIIQIVDSLSQIMRYCIKGADIVELDAELKIIRHYLNIIQIRFDNRFSVQIDIPDTILNAQIPRFILQPLIENAIYHGLEPKYGPGRIHIYGIQDSPTEITLLIQDDGVGMEKETLEEINAQLACPKSQLPLRAESNKGIALLNVNQRIRQLFGTQYGIHLESTPGEGTLVSLRIPFQK